MGREVRKVPADWQHPKDSSGRYIPLFDGKDYARRLTSWDAGAAKWAEGLVEDYSGGWKPKPVDLVHYSDWDGKRPDSADYMPVWSDATHLMMYEDTSEGTPISPAFATPEELARWLADNGASAFGDMTADYEHWLNVARGGWAPSMVISSAGMQSGVQASI